MEAKELHGAYTALMTPMKEGDKLYKPIDYDKLESLIEEQIKSGVRGILACGTTGQSATLSHKEHIILARWIHDKIDNRVQYIAGVGSNNTQESVYMANEIEDLLGPTTFLAVTGYYNNPPQEGIYEHFKVLADSLDKDSRLILYNVPGRTKSNIEANTAIKLAQHPKIIGLKEASGDLEQVKKIIDNTNSDEFRVLSGEDHLVTKIGELGGYGVISASMNVAPKYFNEICKYLDEKNYTKSYEVQEKVMPIVDAVFSAKNPIPLAHMFKTEVRLPLVKLDNLQHKLDYVLSEYSFENLGVNLLKYRK